MTEASNAWGEGWNRYFNATLPQIFSETPPTQGARVPDTTDYTGRTVMLGLYYVDVLGYSPCRRNVHYKRLVIRKRRRRGEGRAPRIDEWMSRATFEQIVEPVDVNGR